MAEPTESVAAGAPKLQIAKIVEGDIMCLRFIGTIDEDFDGAKLAETVKGTLILDLGQVRRISSFGIREWVDFINRASEQCKDIYFIECAPKIIDQFNMVANFGGKGKILSFYAPYRCDYCDDDRVRLVQVEDAWEDIQNLHLPDHPCPTCGNPEYFDEDPQSFFTYLVTQGKLEPDPAVANFLATKLNYAVSEAARRLRIDKHIGKATFIRLAGDIDATFPVGKIAEGLEGDVIFDVGSVGRIDDAGAEAWQQLMEEIAPGTNRIFVRRATSGFVEKIVAQGQLPEKVAILDLYIPYRCPHCGTTAGQLVSVAEHYDLLKFATPPELTCQDCGGPTECVATEEFLGAAAALPPVQLDPELDTFVQEAEEILSKPVAGPTAQPSLPAGAMAPAAAPAKTVGVAVLAAVLVSLVLVGALAFGVWKYLQIRRHPIYDEAGTVVAQKSKETPPWLDKAKAARLWKEGTLVKVVGYSYSARESDEARQKALDDALERLVHEIASGVDDPAWKAAVVEQYRQIRTEAFATLEKALASKDADAVRRARRRVWEARHRVAEAFKATAEDVPLAGEEFWQKLKTSDGTRWRYWLLLALDESKLHSYRSAYTKRQDVQGVSVVSYFPGLAWVYPGVQAGAVVVAVKQDSPWRVPGLEPGNLVVECRRRQVRSAKEFADVIADLESTLKQTGGRLECKVLSGSVVRAVGYDIPKPQAPARPSGHGRRHRTTPYRNFPGNIWDDPTK